MYIENFWGGGVLPNTIMATLRGGGGIKVLKMYYVVCDWSLMDGWTTSNSIKFIAPTEVAKFKVHDCIHFRCCHPTILTCKNLPLFYLSDDRLHLRPAKASENFELNFVVD